MLDDDIAVFVLVLGLGFLQYVHTTILNSKRSKLETMQKKGKKGVRVVLEILDKPEQIDFSFLFFKYFLVLAIGLLVGLRFSEKVEEILQNWYFWAGFEGPLAALFLVSLAVMVVLFLGQIIPSKLGMLRSENVAQLLAPFIKLVLLFANPFVRFSKALANAFFSILGVKNKVEDTVVTEEEVIELIAQGTNSGTFEELEQDMMERVMLLGDRSVASLMTNRVEIEWIDLNDTEDTILSKISQSYHSLFPVCDDELDKVIGILSSKKFLITRQSKGANLDLKQLMDPLRVIPENMKALTALEEFKSNKLKIAVVVDEYGSVQGLITQSDLFEAIVAEHEIPDEENEVSIVQRDETSYLVDALLPFEEFLQYFEIEDVDPVDKTGFHSLGGFIIHLSKQIPQTGEVFQWKNYQFEVVDMDGNRIDKLLVTIHPETLA